MNALYSQTDVSVLIDASDSVAPIPVVKLKWALKDSFDGTVLAVKTTDAAIARDIQAFCASSGNTYLGADMGDGFDVHYIRKSAKECATCSKARLALMALGAAGVLVYTAPLMVQGDPNAPVTFAFLLALVSLPPLAVHAVRLAKRLARAKRA